MSLLAVTLGLSIAAPAHPAPEPPLRAMTFNIRYGTADDGDDSWDNRRDIVFAVIRDEAPDVIGT